MRTAGVNRPSKNKNIYIEKGMPWNQQMSFPSTMELRTTKEGLKLFRNPIKEIETLYKKTYLHSNKTISYVNRRLKEINPELIDFSLTFEPVEKDEIIIKIRGNEIKYKNEQFIFQNTKIPAKTREDEVSIRVLLDRSSIEIFVNDGENVMTTYAVSNKKNKNISLISKRNLKVNLKLNELESSW
jgi:sucrose-6-phosphate hydrolase SacC (GH32 family)